MANILIINGGLAGGQGQSAFLARELGALLKDHHILKELVLAQPHPINSWRESLEWAQGFIFISGTYWDSWSSHLQHFLEQTTSWEGSDLWLGKPAAVLITMHSVGGKAVCSRLQGVLSTLGLYLPPMTSFVYSLTAQQALKYGPTNHDQDFWSLDDLGIIAHNLDLALQQPQIKWQSWKVDAKDFKKKWIEN